LDRTQAHSEKIASASEFLKNRLGSVPDTAVVLGSGLGPFADAIEKTEVIPYDTIPGFLHSTAPGHAGLLIKGKTNGRSILAMQGRFHCYEGYDILDIILPVRVFKMLGVKNLLLTNAAGGINLGFSEGALMLIRDHIGFLAPQALWGENLSEFGPRFPDMTYAYSRELIKVAQASSKKTGIRLFEGVYAYAPGAQYETPAEIRALRALGADAVGMSTVPEVVAGRHAGMDVLAVSCITNMAAGVLDRPLAHEDVLSVSKRVADDFSRLMAEIIKNLPIYA